MSDDERSPVFHKSFKSNGNAFSALSPAFCGQQYLQAYEKMCQRDKEREQKKNLPETLPKLVKNSDPLKKLQTVSRAQEISPLLSGIPQF